MYSSYFLAKVSIIKIHFMLLISICCVYQSFVFLLLITLISFKYTDSALMIVEGVLVIILATIIKREQ